MYENGKRVNGYQKKRTHKRKMKQRYMNSWYYGTGTGREMSWPEFKAYAEKHYPDSDYVLDYWRTYYLSGRRQYAKRETARRARQQFREMINKCADFNDFNGLSPYERLFDYSWEVW